MRRSRSIVTAAVLLWLCFWTIGIGTAIPAHATAPHVATEDDTDSCALCHRAHSAASEIEYRSLFSTDVVGSALIVGTHGDRGDVSLCYVCHGVDAVGADSDVQSAFISESAHVLAPDTSEYGPSPKDCSDCHDTHGVDKDTDGEVYEALLRVFDLDTDDRVFQGEEYCAACHKDRAEERWDGLEVYRLTVHYSEMATPTSGTGIRCSACHEPHGSANPPLIRSTLTSPAAPTTVTVAANDRTLCFGCHTASLDTYGGKADYEASSHALSSASTSVPGAWPSQDATRLVGECQVCHAPMGRTDGDGGVIPELAERSGRVLCDRCHDIDGPASTDLASLEITRGAHARIELVAASRPASPTSAHARLDLYSREPTAAETDLLVGPRPFYPSLGTGDTAVGDIDGDGRNDLVLAHPDEEKLTVYSEDPLTDLSVLSGPGVLDLSAGVTADLVEVAELIADASGRPEIAVVDADSEELYIYRYASGSLSLVKGPLSTGSGPSGLASGDVTGTAAHDLVVTAGAADEFRVFTESSTVTFASSGPFATRSGPRGPSIGDAWAGSTKDEIVICNSGETTATVSVFLGGGTLLGHDDTDGPAGAAAWDSVVADLLPGVNPSGTSSLEVAVALRSSASTSAVSVFTQLSAGGLAAPSVYATGEHYTSGELAAADVDDDGEVELVVGNGGLWSRGTSRTAASVQVMHPDDAGTGLGSVQTLWSGGVETAGEPPALVAADLGGVDRSRHPVDAVEDVHVSTETAVLTRHVVCVDCHSVHEATSTPTAVAADAPAAYGRILGTWGVEVTNVSTTTIEYTEKQGIEYEYELCLKCHSGWSELRGGRNIAFEVNPLNPGEHAVEETSTDAEATSGSYESGWGNDSVLYCVDCHGDSASTEPTGTHISDDAPLLVSPYLGTPPGTESMLCYACHKRTVYYTGADDGIAGSTSLFYETTGTVMSGKEHAAHVYLRGFGCVACHESHGSTTQTHLIRDDVGYAEDPGGGGACTNACHEGAPRSYSGP